MTIFPRIFRLLESGDGEDLKPVVNAGPGVQSVYAGQGPVPGRLAEEDPPGSAVEQRHGAHVAGLLEEVNITVCAQITTGLWKISPISDRSVRIVTSIPGLVVSSWGAVKAPPPCSEATLSMRTIAV